MKPILYLDVDGVLNAVPPKVECLDAFDADGFAINVPVGTPARIRRLSEAFDIRWATAWRGEAHAAFRGVLELPQESWPWLDWSQHKLTSIVRDAGARRWAWVDDDANWELSSLGWTRERHLPDALIVVPDTSIGLTEEHAQQLLDFAKQQSSRKLRDTRTAHEKIADKRGGKRTGTAGLVM